MIEAIPTFTVEIVPIDTLKPHPRNYKQHPDDQLEHIITMIRQHGHYRNIVISSDNYILAGHGVVLASKKMGLVEVPVHRLDVGYEHPEAIKVLVADNEIAHLAEQDDRLLSELLKGIVDDGSTDLKGTGFDEMMLVNLIFVSYERAARSQPLTRQPIGSACLAMSTAKRAISSWSASRASRID